MGSHKYSPRNILITGGAGFIGSNFVIHMLSADPQVKIFTLDRLTYAGSLENLRPLPDPDRHHFVEGDICDRSLVDSLLRGHKIDTVVHFAAESHVDRSIDGPAEFVRTNLLGTFTLLEAVREYWLGERQLQSEQCLFHHISTDEVYGTLAADDPPFSETTNYAPNSPYSASKAGSDHLVRSYHHTYGLPAKTTNCSNNYGPRQHPEKLIPTVIRCCILGEPIPVYGDGSNVRDWLFVGDHCRALESVIRQGRLGETYIVGGNSETANLAVVQLICRLVDELQPKAMPHEELITFVDDRPGHDWRYAIDASKLRRELDFEPRETLESGMRKTVRWYLENEAWRQAILDGTHSGG
ncbi:MAG: dTDP-glucose 4,6-dehydratase, partial [Planctomycetota bacterium]